MDYQLKGKTAFVAAGAHGIGESIANLLTAEGAEVVVADLDADVLAEKASGWRGTFAADLATAEGVERTVAHVVKTFAGPPDILIHRRPGKRLVLGGICGGMKVALRTPGCRQR
jgi:NAD(P)-dependent dehydrogenase (short-subunit alcohol dehydrogenase family)